MSRYWLKRDTETRWREVTQAAFVQAERRCGIQSVRHADGLPATSGFTRGRLRGFVSDKGSPNPPA